MKRRGICDKIIAMGGRTMQDEVRYNYEDLKIRYNAIQAEVKKLEEELSRLHGEEKNILDQMKGMTDEKYEENALALLYEQRQRERKK